MPISYTYNTVFIHIPKCAGTTIEKMLGTCTAREFFSPKKVPNLSTLTTPQHMTLIELKAALQIDWSNYYTFSVVRNPYSRFVSEYKYRKNMYQKSKKPEHNPGTFSSFVDSLNMESQARILRFDAHLETQSRFVKNENGIIDPSIEIFKFENLAPCWNILQQKTGVVYGNHLWSMRSNDETPYQEFYTPEIKQIVYNFYKEDFDNFGYISEL